RGHAAHAAGGRGRSRHRQQGQGWLQGGGQDVQGAPGRLQSGPVFQGRSQGIPAQGVPLLERRRRPDGVPLRQLEGRVPRAARGEPFEVWAEPRVKLRVPRLFNLRSDPFEKAQRESIYYSDWLVRRVFLLVPAQFFVAQWIQSFKDFPPRQKPASFSIDEVMR